MIYARPPLYLKSNTTHTNNACVYLFFESIQATAILTAATDILFYYINDKMMLNTQNTITIKKCIYLYPSLYIQTGDCQCYEGYTTGPTGICDAHLPTDGGVCDTTDTTCYNGATCVTRTDLFTGVDEPHCVCTEGWTGDDCNTGIE